MHETSSHPPRSDDADAPAHGGDAHGGAALAQSWAAFWADAGVDMAFGDDPRDWIADGDPLPGADESAPDAPRPRPVQPRQPEAPKIGGAAEGWPADLADFGQWWLTEPLIDPAPPASRVAPVGVAGARLMVLVAEPAADDGRELLSGADGRMLDAMLAAMQLARADCYLASVLPRHTPAADWRQLQSDGLGALMRHHIALARPQMLAVFGRETLNMLAPERFDPAAMQGAITVETAGKNNADPREIPLLASYPLGVLRDRPRMKALWWQRWLDLSRKP